jgi:integrase/recombinase XerD
MCISLTYKFVLDKRRIKPNNVYPVKLRVYYTGGFKEKSLDIDLNEKDWDNEAQSILKSDPNYKANSYKLSSVKSKLDRRLLLATDEEIVLSAEELLAVLEKKVVKTSNISFNEFANSLINDMIKAGKAGNALAYTDAVNSLVSFTGNNQMRLEDINYTLLERYNTAKLAQGLKVNSIAAYLRSIRLSIIRLLRLK